MGDIVTGRFQRITAALFLAGLGWAQQHAPKATLKPASNVVVRSAPQPPPRAPAVVPLKIKPEDFAGPQYVVFLNDEYRDGHVHVWRSTFKSRPGTLPPEAVQFALYDSADPQAAARAQQNWGAALAKFNITSFTDQKRLADWVTAPVAEGHRFEIQSAMGHAIVVDPRPAGVVPAAANKSVAKTSAAHTTQKVAVR